MERRHYVERSLSPKVTVLLVSKSTEMLSCVVSKSLSLMNSHSFKSKLLHGPSLTKFHRLTPMVVRGLHQLQTYTDCMTLEDRQLTEDIVDDKHRRIRHELEP